MATPEGKVKARVRELLSRYAGIYVYMPVPTGFGRTTLDFLGCYRGQFFCVETKSEGKKPTLRQMKELEYIAKAMGRTFVISGVDSPVLDELRTWLDDLTRTVPYASLVPIDPVHRRPI